MSIFSRKSKSEATWDKLQNLLPKHLDKPEVDWSRQLIDKIKSLPQPDRFSFLINHGQDFFTLLADALSHDQRSLNCVRPLLYRIMSATDLPNIEDKELREDLVDRYINAVFQLGGRIESYDVHRRMAELLSVNKKHDGLLSEDQHDRLVLECENYACHQYEKRSGASGFKLALFEEAIKASNIKKSAALSRKIWANMADRPELVNTDLFYGILSSILPELHDDIYTEACAALRERLDAEVPHITENRDARLTETAKKVRALNGLGDAGVYQNIDIGEPVVVSCYGKESYVASVVSFNNASSDHSDHVVFTEQIAFYGDSACVTSDIRKTLVDQFDTAGSQLADKLDAQSALKPKKMTALLIQ